jgi:hypothetical protein
LEKISPERSKKKETVFPTRATMNSQTSRTVKIIFKAFPDIKVQQITSKRHRGPKRTTREAKKTRKEQCKTLRDTRNQSWRSQTEERTLSLRRKQVEPTGGKLTARHESLSSAKVQVEVERRGGERGLPYFFSSFGV